LVPPRNYRYGTDRPVIWPDKQRAAALAGREANFLGFFLARYVVHYNNLRLNSATGYITPKDMLAGRQQKIHSERDRKLEQARKQRQIRRRQAA
jgi:hypothetical protein